MDMGTGTTNTTSMTMAQMMVYYCKAGLTVVIPYFDYGSDIFCVLDAGE